MSMRSDETSVFEYIGGLCRHCVVLTIDICIHREDLL